MKSQLETRRLILREVRESDAIPLYHMIYHNPNVLKTFLARYMENENQANVTNLLDFQQSGKLIYIIEIKQSHEVIGMLLQQDDHSNTIELGYAIGEPFWNHGYTTEAMKEVIFHLFQDGYTKVTAQCFRENLASMRVMQKCGMIQTKTCYLLSWMGSNHEVIEFEVLK